MAAHLTGLFAMMDRDRGRAPAAHLPPVKDRVLDALDAWVEALRDAEAAEQQDGPGAAMARFHAAAAVVRAKDSLLAAHAELRRNA